MNELAQLMHDLVTRGQEPSAHLCSELAPEERAALDDLKVLLAESPSRLVALLVELGPTNDWYSPPRSTVSPTQP